mgnify:CR=1 FL=1
MTPHALHSSQFLLFPAPPPPLSSSLSISFTSCSTFVPSIFFFIILSLVCCRKAAHDETLTRQQFLPVCKSLYLCFRPCRFDMLSPSLSSFLSLFPLFNQALLLYALSEESWLESDLGSRVGMFRQCKQRVSPGTGCESKTMLFEDMGSDWWFAGGVLFVVGGAALVPH